MKTPKINRDPSLPKFGDRITVTYIYKRRQRSDTTTGTTCNCGEKYWQEREITPREGIYIGWRTLYNGGISYSYDEGTTFYPKEHFRALLVVFSEREKPVFTPSENK